MSNPISPFTTPLPGVPVKKGAPIIPIPNKNDMRAFSEQAKALLDDTMESQRALIKRDAYDFSWLKGKHLLLAGATGPGIGGALAVAALSLLKKEGSLTILGRDLSRSVNFETGRRMQAYAKAAGFGNRFHWLNNGMALDGKNFEAIIVALKEAGTDKVIYVNTVAAANSGLLPGMPPIFIRDVNESGLFQWQLPPLDERSIAATRFVMGTMAVEFPQALAQAGIQTEIAVFADWRGSLDKLGQDPTRKEYGRQGAYSTSLYLPKQIIQEAVSANYGSGGAPMMDIFYPVMRTRALPFIPGGMAMGNLYDELMKIEGVRRIEQPELALQTLEIIGRALNDGYNNPFPRLDKHEAPLDEWFYEIIQRVNNTPNSPFYYKHWLAPDS